MALTYEKYKALQQKLAESGDKISPAVLAQAQAAIDEYENEFLNKGVGAAEPPLAEGEEMRIIGPGANAAPTEQSLTQGLMRRLDPSLPLQPQALAIQPATTHPKGDEAAKDEWVRGDLSNPNGVVVVYDAPAATVRQKILENPQLLQALGYEAPLSPDAVMTIEAGDEIHQAYNDFEYRRVAEEATKAGKTTYRHSKAPWLGEGEGASRLQSLGLKLASSALPALDSVTAFVMGADETGGFGVTNAAAEAGLIGGAAPPLTDEQKAEGATYHPTLGAIPKELKNKEESTPTVAGTIPIGRGKYAVAGGVADREGKSAREQLDMLREDNPGATLAGQVYGAMPGIPAAAARGAAKAVGAVSKAAGEGVETVARSLDQLASWNPANQLWNAIVGKAGASRAPAIVSGTVGGAFAAGTQQAATEGVRAAANLVGEGDTRTNPGQVIGRIGGAVNQGAIAAAPFAALQGLARGTANWVRDGKRYEGIPRRLENNDVDFQFGRGPVPSGEVKAARDAAKVRDVEPIDVMAEKLERPLADAAKGNTQEAKIRVKEKQDEVFASREGRMLIPAENIASTAVSLLRKRTASIRGRKPTPVGTPGAQNPVRGIFNANIEGVSVRPMKGAIPLKVEEADSFLNPVWQQRAVKAVDKPTQRVSRTSARKIDPDEVMDPEAAWRNSPGAQRQGGSGGGPPQTATSSTGPQRRDYANAQDYMDARAAWRSSQSATGIATTPKGIERVPRYGGARRPELPTNELTRRAGDDLAPPERGVVRGSREPRAAEPLPKVTATNLGPEPRASAGRGARWKRRDKEPAAKAPKEGGTFSQQMRRRGVSTVYVMPRRYNAAHHESAIQLLRKAKDTTAKDRDLVQLYNAALKDRDARPWQGVPGGWSALQREHEALIGSVKDTQKRVAPATGTYGAVVKVSKQRKGQSKDIDAMTRMAERAGVNDQLKAARSLDPLDQLEQRISFGKDRRGGALSPLSVTGMFDAVTIKGAFPVARKLENPKGPLSGGQVARVTRVGEDDAIEKRRRARDERKSADYRAAYEKDGGGSSKKKRRKKPAKKVRKK